MTAPARSEPQLEFFDDEGQHEYRLDGKKIPSVTGILSYGADLSRIPAWTSQRGTALHLATEYDDAGDLDEDSVDPLVMPHLTAYRKWKERERAWNVATELRVHGEWEGMRFAGTIDRVVRLVDDKLALLDIKSGAPRKEHGAQLHAYMLAYHQCAPHGDRIDRLFGLYVGKDAEYAVKYYPEPAHRDYFIEKLRAYYAAEGGM